MSRYLTILEVSQKQAYIFGSNKVADNIVNSAVIAKCLSPEFISESLDKEVYIDEANMVYSGGGHTILEFDDPGKAKMCVSIISEKIFTDFEGLEIFAKTIEYNDSLSPKDNLKELTAQLEKKKALRSSAFHHGSFGIEKIDVNTLSPEKCGTCEAKKTVKSEEYNEASKIFTPEGFSPAHEFGKLGMEENVSGFIAVVHIDGNGMGKRVDELYDCGCMKTDDWNDVKKKLRQFSEGIDKDFKDAYHEMADAVAQSIKNGQLKDKLKLEYEKEKQYFPVRRIITAGDDICFVSEGRIGLECARIFIEKLSVKKNEIDKKGYSACAGVAIVHQKYPFYKAYELAEELCSYAKKGGAQISPTDDGRNVSSIDWHIEFGEIKDSMEEIRKDYISYDGENMSGRPYLVTANEEIMKDVDDKQKYDTFKKNVLALSSKEKEIGSGKIKQLRGVIKKGKVETDNYMKFYRIGDDIKENLTFDAIEMIDTFFEV